MRRFPIGSAPRSCRMAVKPFHRFSGSGWSGGAGGQADGFGILQVSFDRRDDHPRFDRKQFDADQRNFGPHIDHDPFVKDPIDTSARLEESVDFCTFAIMVLLS